MSDPINYSKAIFLFNKDVRLIAACYEHSADPAKNHASRYHFKTLDSSLSVGDLAIVPTLKREQMFTIVQVVAVDLEIDIESHDYELKWTAGKFDRAAYDALVADEAAAISKSKAGQALKRRKEILDNLALGEAEIKALPLATNGDAAAQPPKS